ncbi:acyl-CoA-binding domain-containing protein 5-like [Andrographis paniculata]|uniref:acyl-CoA-binding domain-containing protein 5-like n=1 Tax=Andrographis paniculata TaxID=175694 RepID=UPI0021E89DED|nr:acyl-CoA-binding domain-containing protein 5-like [Andrographis paniculata]
MDTLEILLLGVVGFAVLLSLLVDLNQSKVKGSDPYFLDSGKWEEKIKIPNSGNPNPAGDEIIDDWEGIERSELEKLFGEAVVFASHKNNEDKINGDVKLQLYGLQKIALQGPLSHSSQPPLALKLSARAKWSAWRKLGDMSPEMAMEKYVNVLAEAIPCWKAHDSFVTGLKEHYPSL